MLYIEVGAQPFVRRVPLHEHYQTDPTVEIMALILPYQYSYAAGISGESPDRRIGASLLRTFSCLRSPESSIGSRAAGGAASGWVAGSECSTSYGCRNAPRCWSHGAPAAVRRHPRSVPRAALRPPPCAQPRLRSSLITRKARHSVPAVPLGPGSPPMAPALWPLHTPPNFRSGRRHRSRAHLSTEGRACPQVQRVLQTSADSQAR